MEVVPPRAHATTQVEALIEEGNGAPRCGLERFPLRDLLGDRLRDQLADGSPPLSRGAIFRTVGGHREHRVRPRGARRAAAALRPPPCGRGTRTAPLPSPPRARLCFCCI